MVEHSLLKRRRVVLHRVHSPPTHSSGPKYSTSWIIYLSESRTSLIGHRRLGLRSFVSKVFHAISLIKWNLVWKLNIWPYILYHNQKQCNNWEQHIKQTTGKRYFFISCIVVVIYNLFVSNSKFYIYIMPIT